ncbi:MAG: copper-binding protein [Acidobacteria bacterium]|nr:copper-binding protein [Acidobacteriota bacterium]
MGKEVVLSSKPVTFGAFAALCAALVLAASGCTRTMTQVEKPGVSAADTATGTGKANAAEAVRVSAEGAEAAEPSVAAGRDGTVYVAWVEHRGKEADVWLAHFDGEERLLAPPVRVNPDAGKATAWRGDPPTVASAADGAVYVGWTARDEAAPHASTLYLSASRDGGRSFGPPTKVNDDAKPGVHGMHSLAVSGDGRVYMAWLDERDIEPKEADPSKAPSHMHTESNRVVYFASSADGGRTFSKNLRVAGEVCPCCKTSLAVGEDGRVYAAWRQVLPGNFRHIAVASTTDGGQTFSPAAIVSDDRWELQGCPVSGAALSAGADGSVRVLWYTAGEAGRPGLYWAESKDGGQSFSPRVALAEAGGRGTPTLLKGEGGGFKAVWEGSDGDTPVTMSVGFSGDDHPSEPSVVTGGGALPVAVETTGRLFVAYIGGGSGGHSVWLARTDAGAGSGVGAEPSAGVYHGRGVVKAVNLEKQTVSISHEKIEGYMEAMTMDYRVKDASLLNSVEAGEEVDFTLEDAAGAASLTGLRQRSE